MLDFDTFYKDNLKLVKKTVRKYGFRNEDIEDLSQDTFTKIWQGTIEGKVTDLTPGLAKLTADRLCQNKLSVEKNRYRLERDYISHLPLDSMTGFTEEGEQEQLDLDTPEALIEAEQLTEVLDGALNRISPELREVFILKEIQEVSYEVIAERLGIVVDLARKRNERAKDALKALL